MTRRYSRNKYHARPSGGYASRREHRRACELRMLQSCGEISDLREQVSFELIPAQDGEKACHYIADFVYCDNTTGSIVVEDTKGFRTPEYKIKRKLMLYVHGIKIHEV